LYILHWHKVFLYDNFWNINSTNNGGYDATTELQIYNGLFCTPLATSSNAYLNYSSYLYNSSIDYSTISSAGYRFASFCWKLPKSDTAYTGLSFTINSISPTPILLNNNYLSIDEEQIQFFYCFQDASTNTYSQSNYNSVWIKANFTSANDVTTATYFNINNKYGFYTTGKPATLNSNVATISAFIPGISVPDNVYLYLRICIPMNKNISFGSVMAKVT